MAPKSLTVQEKAIQKEKLLAKGRALLAMHGVRKTGVEDIAKAANMAKGSFYQYFASKEAFFFELIVQFHKEWFQKAAEAFAHAGNVPLKERVREHISLTLRSPEYLSIFKYHEEIEELMRGVLKLSQGKVGALMEMEHAAYEHLLKLCQIDTQKVKPGVVHNYLHAIVFGMANIDLMEKDCLDETFEALLDGLIIYIFGR